MNVHVRFLLLFLFMGVVTFAGAFFNGGSTVSYMMFGNPYLLAILTSATVFVSCLILYGLSIWWGPYALRFIYWLHPYWVAFWKGEGAE